MRKYRDYTDEDVIRYAKEVTSTTQLLGKLGLVKAGGNYSNLRRLLQKLKVDTSHWEGQGWSRGKQLKDWSDYTRPSNLKPHIIKERGNKCESCNLTEWLEVETKLELHHIDGDRTHNEPENLKLLCPNCHSVTDSWRKPNFAPA